MQTTVPPPPPPPVNPYSQPAMMHPYAPFLPQYPMPCQLSTGPPQAPIGSPIQRTAISSPNRHLRLLLPAVYPPTPTMPMPDGFGRSAYYPHVAPSMRPTSDHRSHVTLGRCDHLCQSSINQPDFRGRPAPGLLTNPYFTSSPSPMNFSARRSSKSKKKMPSTTDSSPQPSGIQCQPVNRT